MAQSKITSISSRMLSFVRMLTLLALLLSHVQPAGAASISRPSSVHNPAATPAEPRTPAMQSRAAAANGLEATKADQLLVDEDGDGRADPGDTLRYTIGVTNSGTTDAANVNVNDVLDANTSFVSGSLRISPLAFDQSYNASRNTPLTVTAPGLLDNASGTPAPTVITGSRSTSAGGSVTLQANGAFTYTPPTNYTGADSFTYQVTNGAGQDSATATMNVRSAPAATPDTYLTTRNTLRSAAAPGVLGNDAGVPAPAVVSYGTSGNPGLTTVLGTPTPTNAGGTITIAADGAFTYTPPTGYAGTDAFGYTIANAAGSDTTTVTLTVGDTPVAGSDSYSATANTPLSVPDGATDLLANDALGSPAATITSFGAGSLGGTVTTHTAGATATWDGSGSLTVNGDGSFALTPASGFTGPFTFSYRATNVFGSSDTTVTITVRKRPVAVADTGYTATTATTFAVPVGSTSLLANDDRGFSAATITSFGRSDGTATDFPAGTAADVGVGSLTVNDDGSFSFTSDPGFTGSFSFQYRLANTEGVSDATVTITVHQAPIPQNDSYKTRINTTLSQVEADGLLANDTLGLPTAEVLSFGNGSVGGAVTANVAGSTVAVGADGSLTVNADGSFSFRSATGFTGDFIFQYRLANTEGFADATAVITVQQAPTATDDAAYTIIKGQTLNVPNGAADLLANDTLGLPTAEVLSFSDGSVGGAVTDHQVGSSATIGADGSLTVNADGSFSFMPASGFTGRFSFDYQIGNEVSTSNATVTIEVRQGPAAVADTYLVPVSTLLSKDDASGLLANDTRGAPAAVVVSFGGGSLGGTTADHAAGTTVRLDNSGSLTVNADGSFSFIAPSDLAGDFTFQYQLENVVSTAEATVTLTVRGKPTAQPDTFVLPPGQTLTDVSVVQNDDLAYPVATLSSFGVGASTSSVTDHAAPATINLGNGGSLTVNADGTFSFTPATGFRGDFIFQYRLSNSEGHSAAAAVTIQVDRVPVATDDTYTALLNSTLIKTGASGLLANDDQGYPEATLAAFGGGDLGGSAADRLPGAVVAVGENGALKVNADGSFEFTPDTDFVGDFTFHYVLRNGRGADEGSVTITVRELPQAVADTGYIATSGQQLVVADGTTDLLHNDDLGYPQAALTAFGGGTLGGTVTDHPAGSSVMVAAGTLTVNGDGTFTFTPRSSFTGNFTFQYRVANAAGFDDATVTLLVRQLPKATDDGLYAVTRGATLTVDTANANDLLDNDQLGYPEGSVAFFGAGSLGGSVTDHAAGTSAPLAGGVLTVNADGSFVLAAPTLIGNYSFQYRLTNAAGSADATVTLEVRQPPQAQPDNSYHIVLGNTLSVPITDTNDLLDNDDRGYPEALIATFGGGSLGGTVIDHPAGSTVMVTDGTLRVMANGSFSFTPTKAGNFEFQYELKNAAGVSNATVTIEVRQPPVPVDDTVAANSTPGTKYHTPLNTQLTISGGPDVLLANDDRGFPAAHLISFGAIELATNGGTFAPAIGTVTENLAGSGVEFGPGNSGSLRVNADGTLIFMPPTDYTGLFRFKYRLQNAAGSADATVTLAVGARAVAVNDSYEPELVGNVGINTATSTGFSVLTNDTGDKLTVTLGTAANGNVTLNNGTFTFNPTPGYEGAGGFTYTISNGFGTSQATLGLTIRNMIWFVNNQASSAGDGRLGSPFSTLSALASINNGQNNNPAAGDTIFIFASANSYSGPIALLNNQRLIGQGATLPLSTITGFVPPADSPVFPTTGGSNPFLANSSGSIITVAQNNTIRGLDTRDSQTSDVTGTNFGTLTLGDMSLIGGGAALTLENGTLSASLGQLTVASSPTKGISLISVNGTLSATSGGISGAATGALVIEKGALQVTLQSMVISQTNGQTAIAVRDVAGGSLLLGGTSTVNVSGGPSTNDGIVIDGNGMSPYHLTIPMLTVNTSTMRDGVVFSDLAAGSNVTIANGSITAMGSGRRVVNFAGATNGSFNLSNVTLAGNSSNGLLLGVNQQGTYQFGGFTVDNPSGGVGVTVQGTGPTQPNSAVVSFRSITQNGGGTGLRLVYTSGSFTVTGTSSGMGDFPGGQIQGLSGADGGSTGVGVWLDNARNVALNNMRLNNFSNFAVRGTSVTNFTLNNSTVDTTTGLNGTSNAFHEGSVSFTNLWGTASITKSTISNSLQHNVNITNDANTVTLSITGSTIQNGGQTGVLVETRSNAQATLNVSNNTFAKHGYLHFQSNATGNSDYTVTFNNNKLTGGYVGDAYGQSITISSGGTGANNDVTYSVQNNSITGAVGPAINIFQGNGILGNAAYGHYKGTIAGNTIGVAGSLNSGSTDGSGIRVVMSGGNTHTTLVENNQVYQYGEYGILVVASDSMGVNGALNATVRGNTVASPGEFAVDGIHLLAGTEPGDGFQVCADIGGLGTAANTITGSGLVNQYQTGLDFQLQQKMATTVRLPGYTGSNIDTVAVKNYVGARNSAGASGNAVIEVPPGGGFSNTTPANSACVLPLLAAGGVGPGVTGPGLTQQQLDGVVAAALERWLAAGLSADQIATLRATTFQVADLEGAQLGNALGATIAIDRDAAGWGWFVDGSPRDDAEFGESTAATEWQASAGSAAGRMDLLTVVLHELGHMLNLDDLSASDQSHALMSAQLLTGTRRAPSSSAAKVQGAAIQAQAYIIVAPIELLPAGKQVVVSFDVVIAKPLPREVTQIVNQATITADGATDVLTDDRDLPGTADATVTLIDQLKRVYLPLMYGKSAAAADLVVTSLTLSPNKTAFKAGEPVVITAVIQNQGAGPAAPFWADLYINPSRDPALNVEWHQICSLQPCFGLAWGVERGLAPGESVTLSSTVGSFDATQSTWPGWLAAGTTEIALLVDSWNPGSAAGASGDANRANNLFRIDGLRVTGQNPAGLNAQQSNPLSPRPARPK